MKWPYTNARVSLRGPIVTCRDGSAIRLEWRDVHAPRPALGCVPSPAARAIHSTLPKRLWFGPAVGSATLSDLRDRAMRRDFSAGRVDRYLVVPRKLTPSITALLYAVAVGVVAIIVEALLPRSITMIDAHGDVASLAAHAQQLSFIRTILYSALFGAPLAAFVTSVLRRRRRVLSRHLTSDGITSLYSDGRREFGSWSTFLNRRRKRSIAEIENARRHGKRTWSSRRQKSDAMRIVDAAVAHHFGQARRVSRANGMATMFLGFAIMLAVYIALGLAAYYSDLASPPMKHGRVVRTAGETAVLVSVMWTSMFAVTVLVPPLAFGLHRYGLRWRQMWRIPRKD